jgi:uncharacterized membrane protein (UPF0136 family)
MNLGIVAAFTYGILAIIGGIVGYRNAGSQVSLTSGTISGLLLIFSAVIQLLGQNWGAILAIIITFALVIFFTLRLAKTRKFMPAGLMAILGMVALIVMLYQLMTQ